MYLKSRVRMSCKSRVRKRTGQTKTITRNRDYRLSETRKNENELLLIPIGVACNLVSLA